MKMKMKIETINFSIVAEDNIFTTLRLMAFALCYLAIDNKSCNRQAINYLRVYVERERWK
jgi:hypothetical protein